MQFSQHETFALELSEYCNYFLYAVVGRILSMKDFITGRSILLCK